MEESSDLSSGDENREVLLDQLRREQAGPSSGGQSTGRTLGKKSKGAATSTRKRKDVSEGNFVCKPQSLEPSLGFNK